MSKPSSLRTRLAAAAAVVLAGVSASGQTALASSDRGGSHGFRIRVLSNRADLISGGDALVQVVLPRHTNASSVTIFVGGRNVTSFFAVRPNGLYEGVVTGLAVGRNVLTARLSDEESADVTITNYPSGGPIFAGPQVQPWICKNATVGGPPSTDAQCDGSPVYSFFYMSTATQAFAAYDPSHPPAAGLVATTTTDQGVTVPYIVRDERGAMDRGIYDVAVLSDPSGSWAPWAPQASWNHKLLWPFGASAAVHHSNGSPSGVLIDMALSRGFIVADNSLNVHGQNSNDVVSAEAMMMLKEHIAETYGSIRYTIGQGCSGGSIEQYALAATYPGLIDGIQPNCSYQDGLTTLQEVNDCYLVTHYFAGTPSGTFSPAAQAAVEGTKDTSVCAFWNATFAQISNPSNFPSCDLPANLVYNAVTNPTGTRCTTQDYQVAVWGTRPQDGFAKSPYDNMGVQYGLDALLSGQISPEQFVALNQGVGGVNIDFNFTAGRRAADPGSSAIAYRAGSVTSGKQWATVPIIDLRGSHNVNDIHTDFHSYAARARLDQANGTHANQVIWTWQGGPGAFQNITPSPEVTLKSFLTMDQWLTNIEADESSRPLSAKVIRDKPSAALDACFINGVENTDQAACAAAFPFYGDSRIAAGGPLADNNIKCQLKPLSPAAYKNISFSASQWARLMQAFPSGVCNWNRKAVGMQPSVPWLTFAGGPGGQPLGSGPESDSQQGNN
jgi:Tannase-like family of unknown function (DUF6351)